MASFWDGLWDDLLGDLGNAGTGVVNDGLNGIWNDILGLSGSPFGGTGEGTKMAQEFLDYAKGVGEDSWMPPDVTAAQWTPWLFGGDTPYSTAPQTAYQGIDPTLFREVMSQGYTPSTGTANTVDLNALKQAITQGYDPATADLTKIGPLSSVALKGYDPTKIGDLAQVALSGYTPTTLGDAKTIEDNADLLGKQNALVDRYGSIIDSGGWDPAAQGMFNRVLSDQSKQAQRINDSVIQDMQARGIAGGGQELAARLAGNQAAADQANKVGIDVAGKARDRADAAMGAQGNLVGQMRQQDISTQAQNAQAINAFNQYNATAQNTAAQYGAEAGNRAALANNQNAVQKEFQNAAIANDAAKFGASAENEASKLNADYANRAAFQDASQANQIALANQSAKNTASQFGANAQNTAAQQYATQYNQGMFQNSDAQNRMGLANLQYANDAAKFGADAANKAEQLNADYWNKGLFQDQTEFNKWAANQGKLDQNADFSNQDLWYKTGLFNNQASNDAAKWNATQQNYVDFQNIQNKLAGNKNNNSMISTAYQTLINQLNAEQAARNQRSFGTDVNNGLGGTGTNGTWNQISKLLGLGGTGGTGGNNGGLLGTIGGGISSIWDELFGGDDFGEVYDNWDSYTGTGDWMSDPGWGWFDGEDVNFAGDTGSWMTDPSWGWFDESTGGLGDTSWFDFGDAGTDTSWLDFGDDLFADAGDWFGDLFDWFG
ncbi:hypothetical protein [Azospirillum sp. sgz301742]